LIKKNGDKILNHAPAPVAEAVPAVWQTLRITLSATDMIKKKTYRVIQVNCVLGDQPLRGEVPIVEFICNFFVTCLR